MKGLEYMRSESNLEGPSDATSNCRKKESEQASQIKIELKSWLVHHMTAREINIWILGWFGTWTTWHSFVLKCALWQAVVLCQVERAKDAMLNQLYSSVRYCFLGKCFCWVSVTKFSTWSFSAWTSKLADIRWNCALQTKFGVLFLKKLVHELLQLTVYSKDWRTPKRRPGSEGPAWAMAKAGSSFEQTYPTTQPSRLASINWSWIGWLQ